MWARSQREPTRRIWLPRYQHKISRHGNINDCVSWSTPTVACFQAGLVTYGHAAGLKMGWYENGCACGERRALEQNYVGDVRLLHSLGFDGVKLDGCGAQRNMTLYAQLMEATGKVHRTRALDVAQLTQASGKVHCAHSTATAWPQYAGILTLARDPHCAS